MAYIIFLTTVDSSKTADKIAHHLVEKKWAACVNIIPQVKSHFRWKGRLTKSTEWLLIGKTTARGFSQIKTKLKAFHPYEVPELISFKIENGHKPYLEWIAANVS